MLGETINMLVNFEYKEKKDSTRLERMDKDVKEAITCIEEMKYSKNYCYFKSK